MMPEPPTVIATCSHDRCKGEGTYSMVGNCANCKTSGIVGVFTRGHEAASGWSSPKCPVCGCSGMIYWEGLT